MTSHTQQVNPFLTLSAALDYIQRGWFIFPCWGVVDGECLCSKRGECERPGKHPLGRLVPNGLLDATNDEDIAKSWFKQHPQANIAGRTGPESGFWVLDNDAYKGGAFSLEDLERRNGKLPFTMTSRTGSGGGSHHRLFRYPKGLHIPSRALPGVSGIDVKGAGGYIILPPSMHKSGGIYAWEDEDDAQIVDAPEWLLSMVCAKPPTESKNPIPTGMEFDEETSNEICERLFEKATQKIGWGEGRHDTAVWFFVQCKDSAIPFEFARSWIDPFLDLARESGVQRQVTGNELQRVMEWAYSKGRRDPSPTVARKLAEMEPEEPQPDGIPPRIAPPTQEEPEPDIPVEQCLLDVSDVIDSLIAEETTIIPTPLPDLDKALGGGYETGHSIVFATQAGGGKTALLVQCAAHAVMHGDFYAVLALRDGNQKKDTARLAQMAGVDRWELRDKKPEAIKAAREAVQKYRERVRIYDVNQPWACFDHMLQQALKWTNGRGKLILGTDSIHVFPISTTKGPEEDKMLLYELIGYRLRAVHDAAVRNNILCLTVGQSGRSTYSKRKEEDNADLLTAVAGGHVAENSVDVLIVATKPRTDGLGFLVIPKSRLGGQGEKVPVRYDAKRSLWLSAEHETPSDGSEARPSKAAAKQAAKDESERKRREDLAHYLKSLPGGFTLRSVEEATRNDRRWLTTVITGEFFSKKWVEPCSIERKTTDGKTHRSEGWSWVRG